jgi:light-regulated signal transduction histidine kinase (bacteriophytochrome)
MDDFLGNVPMSEGITDYARFIGYHPGSDVPITPEEWPMARSLLKGEFVSNEELDVRSMGGNRTTLLTSSLPLKENNGRITGGLAVFTDITKLKSLEGELKRSNAELQQFAYVASHDMQEPLRMVMNYLALLNKKHGNELSPQAKEYMSTAVEGANRMRQLVDDLLHYSRIESRGSTLVPVDLNEVACTVENNLHVSVLEAKGEVIIHSLPTVLADEQQMTQLLQNLVGNSIKYRGNEPPRVEVSARRRGEEWIIGVRDNGIGIDPQYQDKIFQMFQRLHTKDEYPGTGIGLAISKKIVEVHGGRIWVESELGNGSTFYFSLPRRVSNLTEGRDA